MATKEFTGIREQEIEEGAVGDTLADVGSDDFRMKAVLQANQPDLNQRILFEVHNSGNTALDDFALLVRAHSGAAYAILFSGSDWVSTAINIKEWVSVIPNTLAPGAKATIQALVGPVEAIKFQASVASGSTTLNIKIRTGR